MRRCCFFREASPETSGASPPAPISAYPPSGGSDRSKTPRPGLMAVGDSGDGKSQLPAPAEKRLFRVVVRMGEGGGVEFDSNQAYQKTPDEHYVLRGSFVVLTPLFENEVSGVKNQFHGIIGFSIF